MIKVISWNIATRREPWRQLVQMDADVALLQEARPPLEDTGVLDIGPREAWDSHSWNSEWWHGRGWKALYDRWPMVVRLSDRVTVEWFKQVGPMAATEPDEISVSGIGTIAAARVTPLDKSIEPFVAISMYGVQLSPHLSVKSSWDYADGSIHRIISDLSAFIGHESPWRHRILAAGDLNIYNSNGEYRNLYWNTRERTVFDRMDALGLAFAGPKQPDEGEHPDSPIAWNPDIGRMAPTYYTNRETPATAIGQLDYVFASKGFVDSIAVRALNLPEEWGASDHCRIEILVS